MIDKLLTHAAVRLRPTKNDKWSVYHLTKRKQYIVSPIIAAIIVLFYGGESIINVRTKINEFHSLDNEGFSIIIKKLMDSYILLKEKTKDHLGIKYILNKWNKFGWTEAADYHLASFDFPFVDDANNSYRDTDNSRMMQYYLEEPDLNRSKEYNVSKNIPLPFPREYLETLNVPFEESLSTKPAKPLTSEHIKLIASVTFGTLRLRKGRLPYCADAVRKTSPSGGSRHPTEGYFIILEDINDLKAGIYHFSVSKQSLELINSTLPSNISDIFPGILRASFKPKVVIVLTSIFERNMYRYREPRTLRTIFIDVGHIAENIKILSQALNINYFAHSYIDEAKAEEILGLRKLDEGIIYNVALS